MPMDKEKSKQPKTFLDGHKANFDTLRRAFAEGAVCLLECQDRATGKLVAVICAMQRDDGESANMVPFAKMFDGNPYDELNPPRPEGGFVTQPVEE